MQNLDWVTYAFCVVWLGLAAYLTLLVFKQKKLEKRLQQIEMLKK